MAVVQVTVEVRLSQPWPADVTIENVNRNARREAVQVLRDVLTSPSVMIVGEPRVKAIIAEEGTQ